jgi:energy-converting hydrogenase A subunit H
MVVSILGSQLIGIIPLGDIVFYMTSFNLFMFAAALAFTFIIAISKTETQVEAEFGSLGDREIKVAKKEVQTVPCNYMWTCNSWCHGNR